MMADEAARPETVSDVSNDSAEKPKFVRRTGAVRPKVLIPKKCNNTVVPDSNNTAQTPSSMAAYDDEWRRLFGNTLGAVRTCRVSLEQLKMSALSGSMRNSRFRSVIWRVLLGVLSTDSSRWPMELKAWRDKYEQLKKEFLVDPHVVSDDSTKEFSNRDSKEEEGEDCNNNVQRDDPLSQDRSSTWNRYFCGKEIKREIMQDVVRTFPEVEFFQDEAIRANLINVLFCFSQISKVRYRQGMHEILAPLIFVLQYDQMTYRHFQETPHEASAIIEEGNDLFGGDFLEHDAFSMFCKIMKLIEDWYYVKEDDAQQQKKRAMTPSALLNVPTILSKDELVEREPFCSSPSAGKSSCEGVERLLRIQNIYLKQHDFELFLHLEKLEISPQMYGLRWIRLMFGREFPLQDLLIVWDAIFAIQNQFVLVDYIYISMLHLIRDLLLARDFADALCLLMRYPQGNDVAYVLETALYLYKPDSYCKPKEQPSQRVFLSSQSSNASRAKIYRSRNTLGNASPRENSASRPKKSEFITKVTSQFSSIRRSFSTMLNSSKSTQNLNIISKELSPNPIRRNCSKTRATRPMSLMIQPDQGGLPMSFSSLELSRSDVNKESSPTRGGMEDHAAEEFDSSWKSSLESAPVTPTQEYYNQNDFTKYNTVGGRARAVSGSDATFMRNNLNLDQHNHHHHHDADNDDYNDSVTKELLRLCGYCSKELDSCIDQISGYVTDYVQNQSQKSNVLPAHHNFSSAGRYKYKTPYDDLDSLRQALIRLNHLRNLLSGANANQQQQEEEESKAKLSDSEDQRVSTSLHRNLLSRSCSTHSLTQYLPNFQDTKSSASSSKCVELKSFDASPN